MIEYQLKARCFVHGGNKDSLESIMERIDDALGRTHIHDVNFGECHLVNKEWQNIPNEKLTSLEEVIAKKDAEIDRWRKQALEEDAAANALREENTKLRALVGELADALLAACDDTCDYCKNHLGFSEATASICLYNHQCNVGQAYGRLVAKAREVVK